MQSVLAYERRCALLQASAAHPCAVTLPMRCIAPLKPHRCRAHAQLAWQQQSRHHALGYPSLAPTPQCRTSHVSQVSQDVEYTSVAAAQGPDWQFEHPSGVQVCVFGVEHLEHQPHIGEWILDNRPGAVVVETACTPDHGLEPGTAVTCRDQVAGAAGMFLRVFCQIAAALQEQGKEARQPGAIWGQAASQFNGEQLAYIAAMATGAQLLFGDRPKDITYKRLCEIPTITELDEAYAAEVAACYAGNLLQLQAASQHLEQQQQWQQQWQHYQAQLCKTCVWSIMMREREAVMLGVVERVCSQNVLLLPGIPKPSVALVVGSAHLTGLQELWESGSWKDMLGPDGLTSSSSNSSSTVSPVLQAPKLTVESMQQPGAGAKRGLLEAVLFLSMPQEVLQDIQEVLPPASEAELEPYNWTHEIYGTFRMQLAALPGDLLQQVFGAVHGCCPDDVLKPLRNIRPVNGGLGWDAEVGAQLRTLNFELSKSTATEE